MHRGRKEENIAAIATIVNEDRDLSNHRRLQQRELCYTTTWKILSRDLGL